MVPFEEIEKNEFNLNLPRYIDSQEAEDIQDIEGHLQGGIPRRHRCPSRTIGTSAQGSARRLFKELRPGYYDLAVDKATSSKSAIYDHPEFAAFIAG
jgi:type I restriction enzyme M protein